jgi:hypothetical protein
MLSIDQREQYMARAWLRPTPAALQRRVRYNTHPADLIAEGTTTVRCLLQKLADDMQTPRSIAEWT